MSMKHQYHAYAAATQTVARTRQIVMLYDGAIRLVQQAKEAIRANRIEDRYNLLVRASEIVVGLQACLDFDNGGDIARVLYQFYASIDNRMFSVHRDNSIETCDGIIADLKSMRDVWDEIDRNIEHTPKKPEANIAQPEIPAGPASFDSPPAITVSA